MENQELKSLIRKNLLIFLGNSDEKMFLGKYHGSGDDSLKAMSDLMEKLEEAADNASFSPNILKNLYNIEDELRSEPIYRGFNLEVFYKDEEWNLKTFEAAEFKSGNNELSIRRTGNNIFDVNSAVEYSLSGKVATELEDKDMPKIKVVNHGLDYYKKEIIPYEDKIIKKINHLIQRDGNQIYAVLDLDVILDAMRGHGLR